LIPFREDHDPHCLVARVECITAPREQSCQLMTGMALFRFGAGRFVLASRHPGTSRDEVCSRTALPFAVTWSCGAPRPSPSPAALALLHGPVRTALAAICLRAAAALGAA
jgi:hypothetical protein